jgi:DNA-binding transcriptional ArsR family regulator
MAQTASGGAAMVASASYDFMCGNVAKMLPSEGDPFDALGDPNRRAIVEQLRAGDRSVKQLADALPISRPAVSRHLRLLKQAGLVTDRAEGTRRLYRLHDAGIEAVRAYLEEVWGDAATRFRLAAENTRER